MVNTCIFNVIQSAFVQRAIKILDLSVGYAQ